MADEPITTDANDGVYLTPEEIAQFRRELRRRGVLPQEAPKWEEPMPSRPEWLALGKPKPKPDEPALVSGSEEIFVYDRQLTHWADAEYARCKELLSLGGAVGLVAIQRRGQLEADLRWPDGLYWRVEVKTIPGMPNSQLPKRLIRAESREQARERYAESVGLTGGISGLDASVHQIVITPYEPAPSETERLSQLDT
jgi:hypothetical protein